MLQIQIKSTIYRRPITPLDDGRTMVVVHWTSSHCPLQMYQISLNFF